MNAATDYLRSLREHLAALSRNASDEIEAVARRVAGSISAGGVLHVFGSGHSQLAALEAAERAAGLAAVRAIADPALSPVQGSRAAATERLHGYADQLLDGEDLRPGEVLVVVSHSGVNPVPVGVAEGAAVRGLFVVAVTSHAHSEAAPSRHPAGTRLRDVADVTIDTGAPAGDGATTLADGTATGPLSTILASAALHAVTSRAAELLAEADGSAPVLVSHNLADVDVNRDLLARYADRRRR